ncbi:MAG: hypothetical protein ABW215_23755 [Kibdelosporangium sp.]
MCHRQGSAHIAVSAIVNRSTELAYEIHGDEIEFHIGGRDGVNVLVRHDSLGPFRNVVTSGVDAVQADS